MNIYMYIERRPNGYAHIIHAIAHHKSVVVNVNVEELKFGLG